MTGYINEIISGAVQIVAALIGVVVTAFVVPWLKNSAIPWLKEKRLYGLCTKFVRAAEKLAESGIIDKSTKKHYVIGLLEEKGVDITLEVDAFIESAVEELDLALDYNAGVIAGALLGGEEAIDDEVEPEEEAG